MKSWSKNGLNAPNGTLLGILQNGVRGIYDSDDNDWLNYD